MEIKPKPKRLRRTRREEIAQEEIAQEVTSLKSTFVKLVLVAVGLLVSTSGGACAGWSPRFPVWAAPMSRPMVRKSVTGCDGISHKNAGFLDGVFADLGSERVRYRAVRHRRATGMAPAQGDYAGLQYRPSFYDFDGIFRPIRWAAIAVHSGVSSGHRRRARALQLLDDQFACDQVPGCPDSTHFRGACRCIAANGTSRIASSFDRRWTFTT